jgi:two-component SAPR family response regulator
MKILVMDDVPSRVVDLVREGHDVKTAETITHFRFWWQEVDDWKPDIICLDHDMPYIDGTDLVTLCPDLAYEVVWVWSHNGPAAKLMENRLRQVYEDADIVVHPAMQAGWGPALDKLISMVEDRKR